MRNLGIVSMVLFIFLHFVSSQAEHMFWQLDLQISDPFLFFSLILKQMEFFKSLDFMYCLVDKNWNFK